ncbi:MAG: hypothetical protein FWC41_03030 [Firmicutes bacterium]|nr:hypothetical protein [Bacillota bacterium]
MGFFKKLKKFLSFKPCEKMNKKVDETLKKMNIYDFLKEKENCSKLELIEKIVLAIEANQKKIEKKFFMKNCVTNRIKYWAKRFNRSRNLKEIELSIFCSYLVNSRVDFLNNIILSILRMTNSTNNFLYYDSSIKWPVIIMILHFLITEKLIDEKEKDHLLKIYFKSLIMNAKNKNFSKDLENAVQSAIEAFGIEENKIEILVLDIIKKIGQKDLKLDLNYMFEHAKWLYKKLYKKNDKKLVKFLNHCSKNDEQTIEKNIEDNENEKIYEFKDEVGKYKIDVFKKINENKRKIKISGDIPSAENFSEIVSKIKEKCGNFETNELEVIFDENSKIDKGFIVNMENEKIIFKNKVQIIHKDNSKSTNFNDRLEFSSPDENFKVIFLKKEETIEMHGDLLNLGPHFKKIIEDFKLLNKEFNFEEYKIFISENSKIRMNFIMHFRRQKIIFGNNVKIIQSDFGSFTISDGKIEFFCNQKEFKINFSKKENEIEMSGKIPNFATFKEEFRLLYKKFDLEKYKITIVENSEVNEKSIKNLNIIFENNVKILCDDGTIIFNCVDKIEFINSNKAYKIVVSEKNNTIKMSGNLDGSHIFEIERRIELLSKDFSFEKYKTTVSKDSKINENFVKNKNFIFEDNVKIICLDGTLVSNLQYQIEICSKKCNVVVLQKNDTIKISGNLDFSYYGDDFYKIIERIKLLIKEFDFKEYVVIFLENSEIYEHFINFFTNKVHENIIFEKDTKIVCTSGAILDNYENHIEFVDRSEGKFKITLYKKENKISMYCSKTFNINDFDRQIKENKILKLVYKEFDFEKCEIKIEKGSVINLEIIEKRKNIVIEKGVDFVKGFVK